MTAGKAEVTVVIPLYNKEMYIVRAIDSVLSQTFQDFEVVARDFVPKQSHWDRHGCLWQPRDASRIASVAEFTLSVAEGLLRNDNGR